KLAERAPKPGVVRTDSGSGDASALSTLLLAQLLPGITEQRRPRGLGGLSANRTAEAATPQQTQDGAPASVAQYQQLLRDPQASRPRPHPPRKGGRRRGRPPSRRRLGPRPVSSRSRSTSLL